MTPLLRINRDRLDSLLKAAGCSVLDQYPSNKLPSEIALAHHYQRIEWGSRAFTLQKSRWSRCFWLIFTTRCARADVPIKIAIYVNKKWWHFHPSWRRDNQLKSASSPTQETDWSWSLEITADQRGSALGSCSSLRFVRWSSGQTEREACWWWSALTTTVRQLSWSEYNGRTSEIRNWF